MSIELVRVDNRLIHGQVVEAWVPHVKADRIVVADDESAADPLKRSILELATPQSLALEVMSLADAAANFEKWEREESHVMVLFSGPLQALSAYRAGFAFRSLNVGNVHYAEGKTRVSSSVCCNAAEIEALRTMAREGVAVELRAVPRDSSRRISPESDAKSA